MKGPHLLHDIPILQNGTKGPYNIYTSHMLRRAKAMPMSDEELLLSYPLLSRESATIAGSSMVGARARQRRGVVRPIHLNMPISRYCASFPKIRAYTH